MLNLYTLGYPFPLAGHIYPRIDKGHEYVSCVKMLVIMPIDLNEKDVT